MSTFVFDPLYIKMIEKAIGRKIDDFEKEAVRYGEPIYFQRKDCTWASFQVPYYKLSELATVTDVEATFFEYAFDGGTLKKVRA